ncbi:uncharacterized protein LOC113283690 [Papaver somniferum]|uniref:uncharacterized protein LOC113283690 n=1 Tax=Papaver somniferum TaxID=3469 RepID=UPI000E700557|nr:uncharacterized protein LOC113283690 [Papaver somniferum]
MWERWIILCLIQLFFFANGAIYWMNEGKHIILAFDLAKEECREFPSPPCTSVIVELHVLSGSLFACCYHDQGYGCHNKSIWVLKKSESIHDVIWSKEYSDIDIYIRPIAFTKSGGLLCYDHHDKNVYLYSSKASSSRMLVNFGKCFDAQISHKNTLVSLKALGEENTKLMGSGEKQDLAGDREQSLADELNDFKLAAGLVFTEALRSATLALRSGCILLVLVLQKTKRRVMRFF